MTEKHEHTLSGALVLGNFTLQAQLPQGKTFSVSGYLYESESFESVNDRVNLLHDVLDLQRVRSEIPELEIKVETSIQRLEEIRSHYSVLLKKKDAGQKLTSQEKNALEVMDVNVAKHFEDIEKGKQAVSEAKAKLKCTITPQVK